MNTLGVPEILILLVLAVSWVIPIAVAVWIVVTLYRLRSGQQTILAKLDAIERRLAH
jgi:hypothetical protein